MSANKEAVYDAEINPLMAQIIAICQEHGIAMLASFAIPTPESDSLRCTSALPDESGNTPEDFLRARRAIQSPAQSFAFTIIHGDTPSKGRIAMFSGL